MSSWKFEDEYSLPHSCVFYGGYLDLHSKWVENRKEGVLWIRTNTFCRSYLLPQSTWEILQVMAQDRYDLEYGLEKYVFFENEFNGNFFGGCRTKNHERLR